MTRPHVDVLALVLEDHAQIRVLANDLWLAQEDREELFERLVAKLAAHETAEEEVVHPLVRRAPGGDAIVDDLLAEENTTRRELAELERIGVNAPDFKHAFEKLRGEVFTHIDQEEIREHPKIRAAVDEDERAKAAVPFRAVVL
jgi:hemerythrin superfamily protein